MSDEKGLTLYNQVRKIINDIPDYEIRNVLRILYIFGLLPTELIERGKERNVVIGNAFSVSSINGVDALLLEVKTVKGTKLKRTIAIPLNPRIEPMAEKILNYVESKGGLPVWEYTYENLMYKLGNLGTFNSTKIPVKPYKGKDLNEQEKTISLLHLAEIRELELALCNNFNEIDLKVFNGDISGVDYNIYFDKLLTKNDYYHEKDVYKSLWIKNVIFNPKGDEKYSYKEYMEIQKWIKRGAVYLNPVEYMNIDTEVDISDLTHSQSGSKSHKVLMKNAKIILDSTDENILYEEENLDVYDKQKRIVVECATTYARKMLGLLNENYQAINNVMEFWVLQDHDKENISRLYKFYI